MTSVVISNRNTSKPTKDSVKGSDIPDAFICPITMKIMVDPMASKYGHNYERKAIMEWLDEGEDNCPITYQPLLPSMLISNTKLKFRIRNWCIERGEKVGDDLEQDVGYKVMGNKNYNNIETEDLTESETEEETERDSEIEAEIAKIVATMLRIAEYQNQSRGHVQQQEVVSSKKSRKIRAFLKCFCRKSKR